MGLIATSLFGASSAERFATESALLRGLLAEQLESGGFIDYPGGEPAKSSTRLVLLALTTFGDRYAGRLASEPELERSIAAAILRMERFLAAHPGGGAGFYNVMADLFWDAVYPDRSFALPPLPFTAEAASAFLVSPRVLQVSVFMEDMVPALTILFAKAADRSRWKVALDALAQRVGYAGPERALRSLEARVIDGQDPGGSWLWTVMGTCLNLLALRAMGRDPVDPAIQRGVAYIDRLRMPGIDGRIQQSWCNGENWDAALACDTLCMAGVDAESMRLPEVVDHLLREQLPNGLWVYGVGGRAGDNDTGSFVAAFLAKLAPRLAGEQRVKVGSALRASTETLLRSQQRDGGWGFSPAPHRAPYSFGKRVPFGPEANVIDASTADVTARVLLALSTARAAGVLSPQTDERIAAAVGRGIRFLQSSQTQNGSFWGRWRPGYLSTQAFIMPALWAAKQDMRADWIERARAFVYRSQNEDGGWGETTRADDTPKLAGVGPSTPLHTASAMIALIASATGDDRKGDAPLERAAAYLAERREGDTWHNRRACFTGAFREDYWDSPLGTHAMVTRALAYYAFAKEHGSAAATQRLVCG